MSNFIETGGLIFGCDLGMLCILTIDCYFVLMLN